MTGKELLYIEDALGHLKHMKLLCSTYTQELQDENLRTYVKNLSAFTQNVEAEFMRLLRGGNNNE